MLEEKMNNDLFELSRITSVYNSLEEIKEEEKEKLKELNALTYESFLENCEKENFNILKQGKYIHYTFAHTKEGVCVKETVKFVSLADLPNLNIDLFFKSFQFQKLQFALKLLFIKATMNEEEFLKFLASHKLEEKHASNTHVKNILKEILPVFVNSAEFKAIIKSEHISLLMTMFDKKGHNGIIMPSKQKWSKCLASICHCIINNIKVEYIEK